MEVDWEVGDPFSDKLAIFNNILALTVIDPTDVDSRSTSEGQISKTLGRVNDNPIGISCKFIFDMEVGGFWRKVLVRSDVFRRSSEMVEGNRAVSPYLLPIVVRKMRDRILRERSALRRRKI